MKTIFKTDNVYTIQLSELRKDFEVSCIFLKVLTSKSNDLILKSLNKLINDFVHMLVDDILLMSDDFETEIMFSLKAFTLHVNLKKSYPFMEENDKFVQFQFELSKRKDPVSYIDIDAAISKSFYYEINNTTQNNKMPAYRYLNIETRYRNQFMLGLDYIDNALDCNNELKNFIQSLKLNPLIQFSKDHSFFTCTYKVEDRTPYLELIVVDIMLRVYKQELSFSSKGKTFSFILHKDSINKDKEFFKSIFNHFFNEYYADYNSDVKNLSMLFKMINI